MRSPHVRPSRSGLVREAPQAALGAPVEEEMSAANLVTYPDDPLVALSSRRPLGERLEAVHRALRRRLGFVDRVSVAVYDEKTGTLKTFLASADGGNPLEHYEAGLEEAPALAEALGGGRPRVVNDLAVFRNGAHEHTRRLRDHGYGSGCAFPMRVVGELTGCVFFNSYRTHCFTDEAVELLGVHAHLISHVVALELLTIRTLRAALKTANDMVHYKDPETGNHLERMSRFSRVIARDLARSGVGGFDDETIEHLFAFSPLHDVGKIGIPDEVLLKPARLGPQEWEVMKTHAAKGRAMVDAIIRNFGMESFEHIELLRHVAEHHHETLDGRGYPHGLRGQQVPLAARIVAVADVFDALTSRRPYKEPWDNDRAFEELRRLARDKLDAACVEALVGSRGQVEEIQRRFREEEGERAAP